MKEFYRRHLPHWQPRDAIFFITFRLKNSLPYGVIEAWREERERGKFQIGQPSERTPSDHRNNHSYFTRWDAKLDRAHSGPRWLAQPEIADIVKEAMHYRDGKVFDLHAFCIMPTHVHVVFEPLRTTEWPSASRSEYHSALTSEDRADLPKIMQSLKRQTARKANLILGREGPFWQDESYDHVIRNNEEYARIIHYVQENPVKARLVSQWEDWQWTYVKQI